MECFLLYSDSTRNGKGALFMTWQTRFGAGVVIFAVTLALLLAGQASANTVSTTFSGFTLPDDDSGLEPDVTVAFDFDAGCDGGISTCDLTITLTYNALRDPGNGNVDTASKSFSQILGGVIFGPVGTGFSVDTANTSVAAETLVGAGVDNGVGFPTAGTTDISAHYGFRDDVSIVDEIDVAIPGLGSHVLSSVGDVSFGGFINTDVIGVDNTLPGTLYAGVEANPPNGNPFATLNDATDPLVDTPYSDDADGVWNQNVLTATLRYTGTLTDVVDYAPLFGTDGVVAPEPTTALLLVLGLTGLGVAGRFRSR
jgi:hypothetical protein